MATNPAAIIAITKISISIGSPFLSITIPWLLNKLFQLYHFILFLNNSRCYDMFLLVNGFIMLFQYLKQFFMGNRYGLSIGKRLSCCHPVTDNFDNQYDTGSFDQSLRFPQDIYHTVYSSNANGRINLSCCEIDFFTAVHSLSIIMSKMIFLCLVIRKSFFRNSSIIIFL